MLIYTYDEHGGYYDHVPPPPAVKPDNIPPGADEPGITGAYDRYGFRVPTVIVSPFAKPQLRVARGARPHVDPEADRDQVEPRRAHLPRREREQPARLARPRRSARVHRTADAARAGQARTVHSPGRPAARSRPPTRSCPRARRRRCGSAPRPSVAAMTVDVRTRVDGPRAEFDPGAVLRRRAARRASTSTRRRSCPRCAFIRPRPLSVEVDGEAWTLHRRRRGASSIARAADAPTRPRSVALGERAARRPRRRPADVHEPVGIGRARPAAPATSAISSTGGSCCAPRSTARRSTRPVRSRSTTATAARSTSRARSDPTTTATRCSTSSRPRASCTSTGCSPTTEMDAISADMDRAAPTYTEGDGRSWWARTADGDTRLVRMQGFDRESDGARALIDDARFLDLAAIAGAGHQFGTQAREQQHRGAVQADRRHRGHLRHPVAQGLRHRPPLLRLLRADRRHLGDGRRRGVGSAVGARGLAPRARVVGHPPTRPRSARGSARRRAPATSRCT